MNDNWSKHLDDLESFYHPDRFFSGQKIKPTNDFEIQDQFFPTSFTEESPMPEEAKLSVDIFQDEKNLYVVAPLSGANLNNLTVSLDRDVLTIRGERSHDLAKQEKNYLYKECYWGKFSRSLVLPVPVDSKRVEATLKDGVLKVTLPKAEEEKIVSIKIKED
ncbi:MAG: Hsp20/alpha crystallin family protein [Patescibacteria group bacterium]